MLENGTVNRSACFRTTCFPFTVHQLALIHHGKGTLSMPTADTGQWNLIDFHTASLSQTHGHGGGHA